MPDNPEHGELHSPEDTLNKNNNNALSSTQYQPYQRLQRKKEKLEHKKKEKQVRTKSMWYSRWHCNQNNQIFACFEIELNLHFYTYPTLLRLQEALVMMLSQLFGHQLFDFGFVFRKVDNTIQQSRWFWIVPYNLIVTTICTSLILVTIRSYLKLWNIIYMIQIETFVAMYGKKL